ncbi:MAG TPA: hypothetical protein DCO83_03660 [Mucilaginibacter sp.]|nr:hypothetical protein [Mucilaginibacter sp.]
MKKKVILLLLILVISAFFFIPVNREKTTLIKSSFLNIYGLLANPLYWEKWRPELRNAIKTDSDKILVTKDSTSFRIKYTNLSLGVKFGGTTF